MVSCAVCSRSARCHHAVTGVKRSDIGPHPWSAQMIRLLNDAVWCLNTVISCLHRLILLCAAPIRRWPCVEQVARAGFLTRLVRYDPARP